jgi:hypothetical protein
MKSHSFRMFPFLFGVLFLAAACNNESSTDSAANKDTASNNSTAPTSTVVTTPQHMVLIKHKVKDFAAWKMEYEAHDSVRLANGLHNYVIGRQVGDSSTVLVALKADDMDKAKTFVKDPSLKQRMQKGGVIGTPSIQFVTMTYQDTVAVSSTIRSETVFSVKDWAAWEKNFKDGEQERIDNGITVRAYGHDPDDDKKVRLVTAITDTAKARAYWDSDMLKKRRADGGVMGTPERFVFTVVQRYQ